MTAGAPGVQAFATRGAPAQPRQVRLGSNLIQKDQPGGIKTPASGYMKKPKAQAAPSVQAGPAPAVPVPPTNPYQKGDKVRTACKGVDVEAEVTAVFEDKVQVRTPDGELRWRTIRTVRPVVVPLTPPEPADVGEPTASRQRKRSAKKGR